MSRQVTTRKYCHTKDDIPKTKHYAILVFSSVTIPGDERSKTHPGHGYPEHQESTAQYISYTDKAEWVAEIERLTTCSYSNKDFTPLIVDHRVKVPTQVVVKVDTWGERQSDV